MEGFVVLLFVIVGLLVLDWEGLAVEGFAVLLVVIVGLLVLDLEDLAVEGFVVVGAIVGSDAGGFSTVM